MVTLGNATQRGSYLFVSRHPRWQSQVGVGLSWHEIAVGFANFDEPLLQISLMSDALEFQNFMLFITHE
jgi:hypothetical protein